MHSVQEQAKREFGGWMDGGIRIIWSRYLLRLLAKKKENHPEPAKLPEAENPFYQKSSTEGTFLLQRPRAVVSGHYC